MEAIEVKPLEAGSEEFAAEVVRVFKSETNAAALALYRSTGAERRGGASVLIDYRLDP